MRWSLNKYSGMEEQQKTTIFRERSYYHRLNELKKEGEHFSYIYVFDANLTDWPSSAKGESLPGRTAHRLLNRYRMTLIDI